MRRPVSYLLSCWERMSSTLPSRARRVVVGVAASGMRFDVRDVVARLVFGG